MGNQLIPPLELAPPSVAHLPMEKRVQLWADLVDASEAFLMAGLREAVGPTGSVQEAFNRWNEREMEKANNGNVSFSKTLTVERLHMATNAALATLDLLWSVLEQRPEPVAVMGGISLAAWKHIRATRDVDILISIDRPHLPELISDLADRGFRTRKDPPMITVGDHSFVQFLYTPPEEFYDVQFDLLLAETELQKSAISRRVPGKVPGVNRTIDVLRCDDLILFKLIADRMIDRADAAELARENRDLIDFAYVRQWVQALQLDAEFAEIWREAFPGEPLPW